ncbi:hypothetical protein CK203_110721 [Vitis vinifera]|uniref:Uncharacterized protein n=1 Tax=Vitis vinifera TaxID=29760 RepID=A0A438CDY7_VITVI|nr:hypothetical protein CK203_110721 [Vitis vinifera]
MMDHMHPPRMSAPSCIVPPTEQIVIRPHIVSLLPTFHEMESENPYAHIKEFEEACNTFQEGGASINLMKVKLFPFTLKDKAKDQWLEKGKFQTSQLKKMRNSMSVGRDTWKLSMLVLTMALIHGYCFKSMDESNAREVGRMKSQPNAPNAKVGMYTMNERHRYESKTCSYGKKIGGARNEEDMRSAGHF